MTLRSLQRCVALLAAAFASHGMAQTPATPWPTQPVKIIVPFGAGGGTDQLTRLIANGLTTDLQQSFVVDNKPGAATLIGSELAARAPADGYTLMMSGPASMVTNRFTFKKLNYNPDSFEKVALVGYTPNVLVVNPAMPFKTVQEMVAYAKANPGKLTYASFGAGTTSHLAGEMLRAVAGIDILHVPYKGAAQALPAVVSGEVSMFFDTIVTSMPFVVDGKLRALGVTSPQRSSIAPSLPTIAEQGYPDFDVVVWYGIVAPQGTPKPILDKLDASLTKLMKDPDFKVKFAAAGAEPAVGGRKEFESVIAKELVKTERLVKQSGMTMQ